MQNFYIVLGALLVVYLFLLVQIKRRNKKRRSRRFLKDKQRD